MEEFKLLKQYGCLDWQTLVVGLQLELCERQDLIDFAVDELVRGIGYEGYEHAVLAGGEEYLSNDFDDILAAFLEKNDLTPINEVAEKKILKRWWLALLTVIAGRGLADDLIPDAVESLFWDWYFCERFEEFDTCSCASYEVTKCAEVGDGPCNLRAVKQAESELKQLSSDENG